MENAGENIYAVSHWAGGHLLKETCNDVFFFFLICPGLYESELFNERATRGPGFKSSQFLRN